jgi:hypothetical protein
MAVTDSDGVAAPAWMTRTELAQASGLREDLIARFIPAASTPAGLMYAASQLAEAVYIKELTDQNLHPAAIENKVHEFRRRHLPAPTPAPIIPKPAASRRGRAAIGGTAAAALLLGGVIGSIIGSSNKDSAPAAAAPMVTVEAPAPQFNPQIPAAPDPVCAEWGPIADSYNAKLKEWSMKSGDPNLTSSSWNAEQRSLNMGTIPVFQDQIVDLRRLADKAQDPFLAGLLRAQAMYVDAAVLRLPNYQPSDQPLWRGPEGRLPRRAWTWGFLAERMCGRRLSMSGPATPSR